MYRCLYVLCCCQFSSTSHISLKVKMIVSRSVLKKSSSDGSPLGQRSVGNWFAASSRNFSVRCISLVTDLQLFVVA